MRVLIVEDELKMASLLRRGLVEEGHAADVAPTGEDALWLAQAHPYEAIVLDVMLPGLSGFETCRQLRNAGVWAPVLMLTARDGVDDRVAGLDVGADDYLTKPFSFVVLIARLRALIRRGAPERPAVLAAGDLSLDPGQRKVWRGREPVAVTPREFAMLEFLIRQQGQAVTKRAILENVWDAHFAGDPNIVEVYIGYLRKKIDHPFGRASIETVRGAGYRIVPDGV